LIPASRRRAIPRGLVMVAPIFTAAQSGLDGLNAQGACPGAGRPFNRPSPSAQKADSAVPEKFLLQQE